MFRMIHLTGQCIRRIHVRIGLGLINVSLMNRIRLGLMNN